VFYCQIFNELCPLDEKNVQWVSFCKLNMDVYIIKTYLIHKNYFVYVGEAFITLNWKAPCKYMSLFCRLFLVIIHWFFFNLFFICREEVCFHAYRLGFEWRVQPLSNVQFNAQFLLVFLEFAVHNVCIYEFKTLYFILCEGRRKKLYIYMKLMIKMLRMYNNTHVVYFNFNIYICWR
jgi:hypothetical protein